MINFEDIAEFPDGAALEKCHRPLLERALAQMRPTVSELTFPYLWSWKTHIKTTISRVDKVLLITIYNRRKKETTALAPVTENQALMLKTVVKTLGLGTLDAFARMPAPAAEALAGDGSLLVEEERDRADYVHPARDLRELPGPRFHAKRNHLRRFYDRCPDARYRVMDETLAETCVGFTQRWLDSHPGKNLPDLKTEVDVTIRMLKGLSRLGLTGGAVMEDDRVIAFSLGERLNEDTFVIRVEKADSSIQGSYQAINREFVSHAAAGFRWINREQDLGIPGLRRAKLSYHPHHLVHKYRICRK